MACFEKKISKLLMDPLCGFANWDYKNTLRIIVLEISIGRHTKNKNIDT